MNPTVACVALSAASVFAQGALPRAVPAKSAVWLDERVQAADQVVVKFAEGSDIRLAGGRLTGPGPLAALREALGERALLPLFTVGDAALLALRARVLAATPAGVTPPADLSLYLVVRTRDFADSKVLIQALQALPEVELAYPRELPTAPPGDIPPVTPRFSGQQAWQGVAPSGIDAMAARSITGGWGAGTRVLDIEWGWDFDHEDLAVLRPSSLVGPPLSQTGYNNHGVAVSGELAADPDQFGVTGVTPDIQLRCATDYPASGYSVANAIVVGLPALRAKDVMLLEAQINTPLGLGPTEYLQADFDAIQNATRLGVIVVEAAGNGGVNLDSPTFNRMFDLTLRDSGALIVGATNGAARFAAGFSTYGARVDAAGWGANVATTGYGDLFGGTDARQHYTAGFSGTSSASPMITSTVVALLSAAKAHWSAAQLLAFDHRAIRALLRTYGTPMDPANVPAIGRRPDLLALLRGAGLERGLRVLDEVRIAQSYRLEVTADFAAGPADAWILLAAAGTTNLDLGLPAPCGRLTLDPVLLFPVVAGTFASNPTVLSVPVPNDPVLNRTRLYWQAATVRASDLRVCLGNGAQAYVMP